MTLRKCLRYLIERVSGGLLRRRMRAGTLTRGRQPETVTTRMTLTTDLRITRADGTRQRYDDLTDTWVPD